MSEPQHDHPAIARSVRQARTTAWWIAGSAAVVGTALIVALVIRSGVHVWGVLHLIVQGLAALGMAVGVRLGARRARRGVRSLPDPEALAALNALAEDGDDTTKRVARELMKGLRPEGTELLPAASPTGTGSEVSPEPAPRLKP